MVGAGRELRFFLFLGFFGVFWVFFVEKGRLEGARRGVVDEEDGRWAIYREWDGSHVGSCGWVCCYWNLEAMVECGWYGV
ncbi:uncharacterized protein BDZ99DRAFT_50999 [Mytilinidion resinicola]|uniref:Transmembrane protein n=1 Tax=Mytilinidion resinicola TaxID=574789 RepID=A0A6A6YI82_9PEZI|nr:uncharacterized protein BDZ99DRAFT_50999 [Mytilinidion resinicola]KAF2808279.1 hypothetical protein BDZ99DRAFT_50999 [Mytilinidion resinicola]